MLIVEPIGGLANRMRVIASALWLQKQMNCELKCIWNENYELNAPINKLLKEINGLSFIPKPKRWKYLKSTNQRNNIKRHIANIVNKSLSIDYCIKQKDFTRYVWKNKINIAEVAGSYKNLYIQTCEEFGDNNLEFDKFEPVSDLVSVIENIISKFSTTIGLHIRRNDNELSIKHSPLELFINQVEEEILTNRKATFYLSTDDPIVEKIFKEKFDSQIISHKKEFNRNTLKGMQDAVIDLFCLSKTLKIYGSYWSSFSDVASRIGGIELTTLKVN